MTREEVEMMVAAQVEKVREEHSKELRIMSDRISELEGALDHLRKKFATRLTNLGG
ncbi:hypothetical protein AB4Z32_26345 [Massilia sp. 2TAF26]|uniref:hypothetical protein n=1 Tax=Massilia sp. 2TAF26 TaxID=3233012 RepID=UPI003F998892